MMARGSGMRATDRAYFEQRAREEREAASRAASEDARTAHALLAQWYEDLAGALETAGEDADEGRRRAIIARVSIDAQRRKAGWTPPEDSSERLIPPADIDR